MIFTDRKITIRNGKSSINEPVILYRGDYEVSIKFTIMESKFRFKSGVNLVDSEKASHGQLAILAPYGGNVFSEIVKCEDGTVTFTLTKEMIDQLEEVGLYSFQIRLFDYYRESRVSIPPVEFGIEVREPVASEDHDNSVNNAIVGYSIAKVVDPSKEDVGDTFKDNGQYNKTDWKTGDRITEGKLNKIEDALDKINQNEKADVAALDKRVTNNFNVLENNKADRSEVVKKGSATLSDFDESTRLAIQGMEPGNINAVLGYKNVKIENAEFIVCGKNRFNKKAVIDGYEMRPDGTIAVNEQGTACVSDYIYVGDINTAICSHIINASFYDADKKFISYQGIKEKTIINIPAGAMFIRFALLMVYKDKCQFEAGEFVTSYEEYVDYLNDIRIKKESLPDDIKSLPDVLDLNDIKKIQDDLDLYKIEQIQNAFSESKNIFDKENALKDKALNGSGELYTQETYSATIGYTPVQPDTTYIRSTDICVCFYDANYKHISGTLLQRGSFTTPENCRYIRAHCKTNVLDTAQIEMGDVVTSYESYGISIKKDSLSDDVIAAVDKADEYVNPIKLEALYDNVTVSKNLFNKDDTTPDTALKQNSGDTYTANGYSTTGYIEVQPDTTYTRSTYFCVCFYNDNHVHISGTLLETGSFITPENCRYIRVHCRTNVLDTAQIEMGDASTSYEPYGAFMNIEVDSDKHYQKINEKIAFMGDSVTWGDGGLNVGYIGVIDDYVRTNMCKTIRYSDVNVTGTSMVVKSNKFFGGCATKLIGAGSSLEFKIKSDKVNICRALNRNNAGASICNLYVDGVLFMKIDNYNSNPIGTKTLSFMGDGVTTKFFLDNCMTYNHKVLVNGIEMAGLINQGGYGAEFPDDKDYVVIRAIKDNQVKHMIYFKNAPTGNISVTYDYGESITYVKSTIGELGSAIDSGLESYYGDGTISFDPSKPAGFSSGLDFRKVNDDSFIKLVFTSEAERTIKIEIAALDGRSTTSTPEFIFNFATDGDFSYMNAGIGGFKVSNFNSETSITNYKKVMEFEPDKISILLGTNDDWNNAKYTIHQLRTVDSSYLEENSYYWVLNPSKNGSMYDVKDVWVDVKAIDKYSVTLADDVTVTSINEKNVLLINKWGNDERFTEARIIESYDPNTKIITFFSPIKDMSTDVKVAVKDLSLLENQVDILMNNLKKYINLKPDIYLACMGVPNMNHRQLLGYNEFYRYLANKHDLNFIDLFSVTSDYESSVRQDLTYTITSNGSNKYIINSNINPILRNVRVEVDGVNIYDGYNVRICGGYGYYWNTDLTHGYKVTPTKLILTTPIPAGKTITIKGSTTSYSNDYCHMNNDYGKYLYGHTILNKLLK